jgi:hypothetical protein
LSLLVNPIGEGEQGRRPTRPALVPSKQMVSPSLEPSHSPAAIWLKVPSSAGVNATKSFNALLIYKQVKEQDLSFHPDLSLSAS